MCWLELIVNTHVARFRKVCLTCLINLIKDDFGKGLVIFVIEIYFNIFLLTILFSRAMVVLKQTYRSHFRILRPCSYLFYNNMLMANEADNQLYKLCEWEGLPTKVLFLSNMFEMICQLFRGFRLSLSHRWWALRSKAPIDHFLTTLRPKW